MQGRRDFRPNFSASSTLISPAMPAAAVVWPMLLLTEPMPQSRPAA